MFFPFHDDNPTRRTPVLTLVLIALNAWGFFQFQRLPPLEQQRVVYHRGFVPARIAQLTGARPGPILVPLRDPRAPFGPAAAIQLQPAPREILASLITCMFLHGGWLHLIGNMWFLWLFGNNVEDCLGPVRYVVLYLVGGLLASAAHWLVDPASTTPVIGASGAVATILGAYAVTWPWARVHTLVILVIFITVIDLPALLVLGVWFLAQVASGRQALAAGGTAGVAWWAHVGGFVAGLALMPLLRPAGSWGASRADEDASAHGF